MKRIKSGELKSGDVVVDDSGEYLVVLVRECVGGCDIYYADDLVEFMDETSTITIKEEA